MTSDPIRLLDDPAATAALRDDLGHATEVTVQGLDHAAGLSALQAAMASAARPGRTSVALKVGGAAVVVGVLLWLLGRDGEPEPAAASASEPEVVVAHEVTPRSDAGARGSAPGSARTKAGTEAGAEAEAAAAPTTPEAEGTPPVMAELGTEVVGDAAVVDPAAVDATHDLPVSRERTPKAATKGDPSDAADREPAPADADADAGDRLAQDMLEEAELVARARGRLEHDPAQALALAEDAERVFPEGHLIEERRAIAIRALVALGRVDEARRRADAFLATFSRGAHAAAVRRALAEAAPTPSN